MQWRSEITKVAWLESKPNWLARLNGVRMLSVPAQVWIAVAACNHCWREGHEGQCHWAGLQEEAARISREAAALQEQQAAYVGRRAADTADLVRREEAAAAFEAGQAQVHGGRRLWGRPATRQIECTRSTVACRQCSSDVICVRLAGSGLTVWDAGRLCSSILQNARHTF